jgi:hypothetical protein
MVLGLKTVETRGWKISYRGPVIIHSAQKITREMNRDFVARLNANPEDRAAFAAAGYRFFSELPFGQSLAIADLVDCVPVEKLTPHLSPREFAWGDYSTGRFGWIFANLRRFERPRHVSGAQGLWEWKHGSPEVPAAMPVLPAYRLPAQIQRPPFAISPSS